MNDVIEIGVDDFDATPGERYTLELGQGVAYRGLMVVKHSILSKPLQLGRVHVHNVTHTTNYKTLCALQLPSPPLPILKIRSFSFERKILELGKIATSLLVDDSSKYTRYIFQLSAPTLGKLQQLDYEYTLRFGNLELPNLQVYTWAGYRSVLHIGELKSIRITHGKGIYDRHALRIENLTLHNLRFYNHSISKRYLLDISRPKIPFIKQFSSMYSRHVFHLPYRLDYYLILTQSEGLKSLRLGHVLGVHGLRNSASAAHRKLLSLGGTQTTRHALRQKHGNRSLQLGYQAHVIYHGNYAWLDDSGKLNLPVQRMGVLHVTRPKGGRALENDSPLAERRALQLPRGDFTSKDIETRRSPVRHRQPLFLGIPEMERSLRPMQGYTQFAKRHALRLPAPAVTVSMPSDIVWQHSLFQLQGTPVMPWGPTQVQGMVDCARMIVPDVGAGHWSLSADPKWLHDGFEGALAGGGAWQTLETHADGSASGTFSGFGIWGGAGPEESTYFDDTYGEVVEASIGYSGGIWGGDGTWSVSSTGALSWMFVINKGNGWRLKHIKKIGTSPANIIEGEGVHPDFSGGGNAGFGFIKNAFRALITDWSIPPNPDGSEKSETEQAEWFQNLLTEGLTGGPSINEQLYKEKNKPPEKNDNDENDDEDLEEWDFIPLPLPDNNEDFEDLKPHPSNKQTIIFSGGAQLVGPVPGLLLAEKPTSASAGSIVATAPVIALHSKAHAKGIVAATGSTFGRLQAKAHARDAYWATSADFLQSQATANGYVSLGAATGFLVSHAAAREALSVVALSWDVVSSVARAKGAFSPLSLGVLQGTGHAFDALAVSSVASLWSSAKAWGTLDATATSVDAALHSTAHARGLLDALSFSQAALLSRARALGSLYAPDAAASCWVMTMDSHAVYVWDNWPFTHMVQIGDKVFAAGPEGLAVLEGDSDAGRPIDARVQYGFSELGGFSDDGLPRSNEVKKRVPYVVFGYSAKGAMRATCETYGQGLPIFRYEMPAAPAAQPINNRIAIGKGLHARYWRFGLENAHGCDFVLHSVSAEVALSKKRL